MCRVKFPLTNLTKQTTLEPSQCERTGEGSAKMRKQRGAILKSIMEGKRSTYPFDKPSPHLSQSPSVQVSEGQRRDNLILLETTCHP